MAVCAAGLAAVVTSVCWRGSGRDGGGGIVGCFGDGRCECPSENAASAPTVFLAEFLLFLLFTVFFAVVFVAVMVVACGSLVCVT